MLRRPLSLVCLAVIVVLYLGTRLATGFPSCYEDLEGKPVTVVGKVYQKEYLKTITITFLNMFKWKEVIK